MLIEVAQQGAERAATPCCRTPANVSADNSSRQARASELQMNTGVVGESVGEVKI